MELNHQEIVQLEKRYRTQFVNALGGFKSVLLVGTKSPQGNENLAIMSSLFHLGANPSLCGLVIRPNEEKENTLGNIVRNGHYTLNHIQESFYTQAHHCSAKFPPGVSEFEQVGLTPQYIEPINAPFVQESAVKFACELIQKIDIEFNGTFILVGKIIKVIVPDHCIAEDGFIDLEKAGSITCSGLDSYHNTNLIARLSYAQTDQAPHIIHPRPSVPTS